MPVIILDPWLSACARAFTFLTDNWLCRRSDRENEMIGPVISGINSGSDQQQGYPCNAEVHSSLKRPGLRSFYTIWSRASNSCGEKSKQRSCDFSVFLEPQ